MKIQSAATGLRFESLEPRVAIVGPVYPLGGGVSQHVARLAVELEDLYRGAVRVESWKSQYPSFLHRAQVVVQEDAPEITLSVPIIRKLRWYSPLSWSLAGLRSRNGISVLFNVVTPYHAIPLAGLRLFLRRTTITVGIIHNALPHERTAFDRMFLRLLANTCDAFIVHDVESEELLSIATKRRKKIAMVRLPSPWDSPNLKEQSNRRAPKAERSANVSALFFGNVRPYKGVRTLLEAMQTTPGVVLTIAGNFWNQEAAIVEKVEECGLTQQVILKPGYVDKKEIPNLFCQADVVILPYLSGTASVIPQIAFSYGVPVIVTNVGSVAAGVEDGVNGLVVGPNDSQELARAISAFVQSFDLREKLTLGARASKLDDGWGRYTEAVVKLVENGRSQTAGASAPPGS